MSVRKGFQEHRRNELNLVALIGFAEVGLGKIIEKKREVKTTLSNCYQLIAGAYFRAINSLSTEQK